MTSDGAPRRGWRRLAHDHRWVVAVAVLGAAGGITFGTLTGMPPAITLGLAAVVIVGAVVSLTWSGRRRIGGPGPLTVISHFGLVTVVVFAAIQAVPYGRDHENAPVTGEPAWSSERTRELMVNACYGCHSNEVEWPWYSNVAPISWALTRHVEEGRDAVNYSEFATDPGDADETIEVILEGEMPPSFYTAFGLHPEANLSDAEIAELVAGLRATPGMSEDDERGDDERDDD